MASVTSRETTDNTQPMNDSAAVESQSYYQKILEMYNNGEITDEEIIARGKDSNTDVTSILDFVHMTALEREMHPLYKSDLSDKAGYETVNPRAKYRELKEDGDSVEIAGCKITLHEKEIKVGVLTGKTKTVQYYSCESDYLGNFDYSPEEYRVGYKEIKEKDGSVSQLPVLEYIGSGDGAEEGHWDWLDGADAFNSSHLIYVPNGVKSLDYTFDNCDNLMYVPHFLPPSVKSMHCAFKDCDNLEAFPDNTLKGKKRNIYLPSTLEDASQAFEGCPNLGCSVYAIDYEEIAKKNGWDKFWWSLGADMVGEYGVELQDQLPESLKNATNMFCGCEAMSEQYASGVWFWESNKKSYHRKAKYGGELTPYLAPDLVRGIYDNISDRNAMVQNAEGGPHADSDEHFKDHSEEFIVNKDGTLNTLFATYLATADAEVMQNIKDAQAAQMILQDGKEASGHADTSVEVSTDGYNTNNAVYEDENTKDDVEGTVTFDATGEKKSKQLSAPDSTAWWETLAVDGAVGLGLYGATNSVIKSVTGSDLLGKIGGIATGVVGTVLLDYKDIIPGSLYPVVKWTADILPECKLKDSLIDFANSLPSADSYRLNKQIDAYNEQVDAYNEQWNNDFTLAQAHYGKRLSDVFQGATSNLDTSNFSMLDANDMIAYMKNNGDAAAKENSFWAIGYNGEDCTKSCVYDVMHKTISAAEGAFEEKIKNGGCTEDIKKDMAKYYVDVMAGLESYNTGAMDGINKYAGNGTPIAKLEKEGLAMVNRAYTQATMDSLKAMNDKYHFMTAEDWQKVHNMSIDGINVSTLSEYNSASYFDTLKADSKIKSTEYVAEIEAAAKAAGNENIHAMPFDIDIDAGVEDAESFKETASTDSAELKSEIASMSESTDKVSQDKINSSIAELGVTNDDSNSSNAEYDGM